MKIGEVKDRTEHEGGDTRHPLSTHAQYPSLHPEPPPNHRPRRDTRPGRQLAAGDRSALAWLLGLIEIIDKRRDATSQLDRQCGTETTHTLPDRNLMHHKMARNGLLQFVSRGEI
ncbi:hypothetical protein BaRGS_00001583 [Batillaria attramentaria]|uniref:Uncharacterized protein n=1 Tax=Batillaria attramentaria TaxID=370345 RepID=A0ABD0M8S2_9CAEN